MPERLVAMAGTSGHDAGIGGHAELKYAGKDVRALYSRRHADDEKASAITAEAHLIAFLPARSM